MLSLVVNIYFYYFIFTLLNYKALNIKDNLKLILNSIEFDSKNTNRNKINKSIYSLISNIIVILCSQIIEFSYFLLEFRPKCDAKSLGVIKFIIKIFKLE